MLHHSPTKLTFLYLPSLCIYLALARERMCVNSGGTTRPQPTPWNERDKRNTCWARSLSLSLSRFLPHSCRGWTGTTMQLASLQLQLQDSPQQHSSNVPPQLEQWSFVEAEKREKLSWLSLLPSSSETLSTLSGAFARWNLLSFFSEKFLRVFGDIYIYF